ncbi:YbjQ family protein [Hyunsoonleella sp. 2307UL5-6]|uniref:YbjQ family protein n=1 Tax=Hyunsoonleella sp. 2307UL5-6 TaxID=3384768 RepID=UPI0039BC6B8C
MILTTTNSIEGYTIKDYISIISGVSMSKKAAKMGFSMSKYYNQVEKDVETIKEEAFQKLLENAKKTKANAVVGIKVEIELTTSNFVMVSITGTAVKVA